MGDDSTKSSDVTAGGAPLRVVHVVPTYLPATRYGGPIYSVHGLCKALVRLGHHVEVVTTNDDGAGVSDVPLDTPVLLDGVVVRYYQTALTRRLGWAPQMHRGFRAALTGASVLHLHSVFMWPTFAAARTADRLGVPYILAPRGALVPKLIRRNSYLQKTAWIKLIEARTVSHAARLHVTSDAEYRDAEQLGLRVPPRCLLPNGIDIPSLRDGHALSAPLAAAVAAGPYVLFLGRISWIKGLDRAIRALAGTDLRLLIAGHDDEGLRPSLQQVAQEFGVGDRAVFVGSVAGDDKWRLLQGARVLILPSYNENFGNVVVEAMAMGCPVVVTPEVGAADVVKASGAGIVARGEPVELRTAMLSLWRDAELRERLGQAGARYVQEHLTWDAIGRRMVECYREVIAERMAEPTAE